MAVKHSNVNTQQVLKRLNEIDKSVNMSLESAMKDTVNAGYEIAVNKLAETAKTPTFTQKYGSTLVDYLDRTVTRKYKNGTTVGRIYAKPTKNENILSNLFYAEYGAGIMSSLHGGDYKQWKYHSTEFDPSPVVKTDKRSRVRMTNDAVLSRRRGNYKYQLKRGNWIGVTSYSKPAHYMRDARLYININARETIANKIKTVLYDPRHIELEEEFDE